ncbi:MAG: response regulator [Lachnospiraceae bacterium]|nr:response regulator [Lachnospiraceae bacterium]
MKKKILLIGELGDLVRSLNECLMDDFQVQLCSKQAENVKAMVKIIRPSLIIICQLGLEKMDSEVFEVIQKKCSQIPTIGITTSEGWKQYKDFYESKQFTVLFRPFASSELLEKCYQLLGLGSVTNSEKESAEKPQQKKKIMIVDDSPLLLRRMKTMLEEHYDICLAKSGEQALEMIPGQKPDLILLDYEMDGMDGKDTFEAMKADEEMQSIPVVFLTSIADRQVIYSVMKSKPEGYILKPPDDKRIMETIEEVLGKKK